MRAETRLGSFEAVSDGAPQHASLLEAVRALAHQLHPDGMEFASTKERSVSWGWGEAKMSAWYAYVMPHARHVNLGFFQGVHLPDPEGLLEGTGKTLRHVKLTTADAVNTPAIRALLIAARDERRRALTTD